MSSLKIDSSDKKVLYSTWFTEMGCRRIIGIVVSRNEVGKIKMYIGTGAGVSVRDDENMIAKTGARVHLSILSELMDVVVKTKCE